MPIVNNPQEYDDKEPTNIRLVKGLKDSIREEAETQGTSLSDVVNEILEQYFKKKA